MKETKDEHRFFYVDETGDPNFYAKGRKLIVGNDGCSRTFSLGFLRTSDPEPLRQHLLYLRTELVADRYLRNIPSRIKTSRAFHAKDDCPEVRKAVFDLLNDFEFSVQVVVALKRENLFIKRHNRSQDAFYNDLTTHLFERQLHLASRNTIMFARRGDKTRQHTLRAAVDAGIRAFRSKYPTAVETIVEVETTHSAEEPLLQVADYALWAVHRAFESHEMRYFDFLADKIELVWDIYDTDALAAKRPVIYGRRSNPFHIDKISPLS